MLFDPSSSRRRRPRSVKLLVGAMLLFAWLPVCSPAQSLEPVPPRGPRGFARHVFVYRDGSKFTVWLPAGLTKDPKRSFAGEDYAFKSGPSGSSYYVG